MNIQKQETQTGGRYVVRINDYEAEMTFSKLGDSGNIIVDHTGVPKALEGQGIGSKLVDFLIADARENRFKIMPLCPFVRAKFAKHPDWADLKLT